MPEFVSALSGEDSETVVSVTEGFAKAAGLEVVNQPATDRYGRPLGPRPVEKRRNTKRTPASEAASTTDGGESAENA